MAPADLGWMRDLVCPDGLTELARTPWRVLLTDEWWTIATNGSALCAARAVDEQYPVVTDAAMERLVRATTDFTPGPIALDVADFRAWLGPAEVRCTRCECGVDHLRPWRAWERGRIAWRRLGGEYLDALLAAAYLARIDVPTLALRIGSAEKHQPFQFHGDGWRVAIMPCRESTETAPSDVPEYLRAPDEAAA